MTRPLGGGRSVGPGLGVSRAQDGQTGADHDQQGGALSRGQPRALAVGRRIVRALGDVEGRGGAHAATSAAVGAQPRARAMGRTWGGTQRIFGAAMTAGRMARTRLGTLH
jgi:hypothetical protein